MLLWLAHTQDLCSQSLEDTPVVGVPGEPLQPLRGLVPCAVPAAPLLGTEEPVLLAPRGRGGVALRGRKGVVLHGPARKQVPMYWVLVEVLLATSLGVAAPMLGEQAMGCSA